MKPGYFHCEVYRCTMPIATCLARRANAGKGREVLCAPGYTPGAFDVGCRDCEQGRRLEMGKNEAVEYLESGAGEGKVCDHPNCPHGGKEQPAVHFYPGSFTGGRDHWCRTCRSRHNKGLKERRAAEGKKGSRAEQPPVLSPGLAKAIADMARDERGGDRGAGGAGAGLGWPVVDLGRHPEVAEAICSMAREELRTPEDQAVWLLLWHVRRGVLKKHTPSEEGGL